MAAKQVCRRIAGMSPMRSNDKCVPWTILNNDWSTTCAKTFSTTSRRHDSEEDISQDSKEERIEDSREETDYSQKSRATVIISGASSGIGFAIAKAFTSASYSTILIGRNTEKLARNVEKLKERNKPGLNRYVNGDIRDPSTLDKVRRSVEEHLEQTGESDNIGALRRDFPTILVNCAGVAQYEPLVTTSAAYIDEIIATNLRSAITASSWFIKQQMHLDMKLRKLGAIYKRPEACIINVSSVLATHGGTGATVYAASKAGLLGFTRSLAAELGQKRIRVNAIIPGYISTPMTDVLSPMMKKDVVARIPLGRFGAPGEVAAAAVFLARNTYAHNCEIRIDGGLSTGM